MAKKILVVLLIVTLTLGVLAGCNKREVDKKTHEEFLEVLPEAKNFSKVDISGKNIPSTIEEAYYDTEGAGFVIKVVTRGFQPGLTIIVGIDNNGVITGAKCTESNESWGYEENLGKQFIGRDIDTYVDVQAGATSLTVNGYRNGIGDALQAYEVLKNRVHPDHNHGNSGGGIFDDIFGGNSENEAFKQVMPDAKGFDKINISGMGLPSTVAEIHREISGLGYVVMVETSGYNSGLKILVAVDPNHEVIGATCIDSNETNGVEQSYGDRFTGLNINGVREVDTIAGSTLTTRAYRDAVIDALNAISVLEGGTIDDRDPEEILLDNLQMALPAGRRQFTKMFLVEVLEGVDKVYVADNGKGYVIVIGDVFVGVGADGVAVNFIGYHTEEIKGDTSEYKSIAETAVSDIYTSGELTEVALTTEHKITFQSISERGSAIVTKLWKTESGNYVVDIKTDGFGILGDGFGYISGSGGQMEIRVSLTADGKVIDAQTVHHSETDSYGGLQLKDGAYNSNFIGKTEADAKDVDIVSGCTRTTVAFKYAILLAFETVSVEGSSSGNYTLGMGASVNFDNCTMGTAQVDATVATVVLDERGKIVACRIDAAQNTAKISDGEFEITKLEKTKAELLYDYRMSVWGTDNNYDGVVKEWFEQARAFESYVVGKTVNEVKNMGTQTVNYGYVISSDEELLSAGCTIQITEFIDAVVKACNDDQSVSFVADDFTLGLVINSYDDGSENSYNDEGLMRMYSDFAAAVVSDGKIVATLNDSIQPQIAFDYDGYIMEINYNGTKRELKDSYGMSIALNFGMDYDGDGRVLEWYQQSAAFSQYVVGMTASEVKNMSTKVTSNGHVISADYDLVNSGCTISIDGMKQAVYEAASNAR